MSMPGGDPARVPGQKPRESRRKVIQAARFAPHWPGSGEEKRENRGKQPRARQCTLTLLAEHKHEQKKIPSANGRLSRRVEETGEQVDAELRFAIRTRAPKMDKIHVTTRRIGKSNCGSSLASVSLMPCTTKADTVLVVLLHKPAFCPEASREPSRPPNVRPASEGDSEAEDGHCIVEHMPVHRGAQPW
jgi:hypothetical protein